MCRHKGECCSTDDSLLAGAVVRAAAQWYADYTTGECHK